MSYVKCAPCRIRLDRASPEIALFDGLCPMCGTALEPAEDLTELVGFRSFDMAQGDRSFDAPRWLDDGGSFSSETLARWTPPGADA